MKHFWFALLILVCGILLSTDSFAQDITFEVTVDKAKVSLGESVQLSLGFYGTQAVPTPYFPGVDGFDWRYLGPSKMTSIINNQVSTSITHRYKLIPLREGKFEIPSFSVQFRGKTYSSEPISIEVVRGPVGRAPAARKPSFDDSVQKLKDRVFVTMEVDKQKAYVNEIIPVKIKLYANNVGLRDIQYPRISHEGFSIDEFDQPRQYQETVRGALHNVMEFKTNAFATRAGELKLGSAQIECNLLIRERRGRGLRSPFFDDFFGRFSTYPIKLDSIGVPITVSSLPQEEKPTDFSGAVGNYSFSLSAEPREVKVGDPVTLKMTISGKGNFKTVDSPALDLKDGFKVYDPDVKRDKRAKIFEQIIVPKNDKICQIPPITFSFFDPKSGKYKKTTKGPIPIKVKPLPKGEELKIFEISKEEEGVFRRKEILGRDIIYIKDTPGKLKKKGMLLCKNRLFIMLQFIPLFVVGAILVFQRRRERLQTDIGYARRLRAHGMVRKSLLKVRRLLDSQKSNEFFDAVFKTLQEYLGDKFQLPIGGITSNVIEELRLRNVDQETLDKIGECFNSCDTARYAPSKITKDDMLNTFKLLDEIIVKLERIKT